MSISLCSIGIEYPRLARIHGFAFPFVRKNLKSPKTGMSAGSNVSTASPAPKYIPVGM